MLRANEKAPEFELPGVGGGQSSLLQILSNGRALLAFFKVGCPTCQLTFPFLDRIAKGGNLQVAGISQDSPSATRDFRERLGVTFLTLLDDSSAGYPVSKAYQLTNVPTLFLVDPDRTILSAEHGFSKAELTDLGRRAGVEVFTAVDNVPEFKPG